LQNVKAWVQFIAESNFPGLIEKLRRQQKNGLFKNSAFKNSTDQLHLHFCVNQRWPTVKTSDKKRT